MFNATSAIDYYLFVPTHGTGRQFQLVVTWFTEQEAQATQSYFQTQVAQATLDSLPNYTEIEPNDSRQTANIWDMSEPFTGELDWGDVDHVQVDISTSGIYTFSITDVSPNLQVKLYLSRSGRVFDYASASSLGEPLHITFDASAGEQYFFTVGVKSMADYDLAEPYQLDLTRFIPDLDESNDDLDSATIWDVTQGPVQGYFWDKAQGRADYFKIIAPQTQDSSSITFNVTNPEADIRIRMSLLNYRGAVLEQPAWFAAGEPGSLTYSLEAGQEYYIKLAVLNLETSSTPYILSIDYQATEDEPEIIDQGLPYRLKGHVYRMWGPIPIPVSNVEVYAQINGGQAILLDTTNFFGGYDTTLDIVEGQEVRIWPVITGTNFDPAEDTFYSDLTEQTHNANFMVVGGQVLQETPPEEFWTTTTPIPPLIQTALAITETPMESETLVPTPTPTATHTPTPTSTMPVPPTSTVTSGQTVTISGTVWRLFNSGPVGVDSAEVILSINGIDQPAAFSMIDGTYGITANIQEGDNLTLRAQSDEDDFEPLYYSWPAETGVEEWTFEFYAYWDTITPPENMDQNRIYGTIVDENGQGVPGVYLDVVMGTSDAIQLLGPTDANGYFDNMVTLPNRVMVTVWANVEGVVPSRIQFFHAYASEERELHFWLMETPSK
jgi:hypothetical protein